MYLIFYFDEILCSLPFPTLDAWSLAYTIRKSVPHSQHPNFGICDKEIRERRAREQRWRNQRIDKQTLKSPGSKQLPGPPIRIKGLPRYLSRTPIHLSSLYIISPYRFMGSILLFKYLNMGICPSTVINPYLMQISFKVKVII